MTLSTQNKLLLWFSTFSTIIGVFFIVGIILFFLNTGIHTNTEDLLSEKSFSYFFFSQSSLYVILSIVLFSFYVPVVGYTVYFTFEKTKSPEMLYFFAMLIGFFCKTILLCIPLFSLQNGYTVFLQSISSIAFFGQMQVIVSILFQGVLVSQADTRDSDKFIGIVSVVALAFSVIVPIDVRGIATDFSPQYGFNSIFEVIRIVFIVITFASMYLSPTSKKSDDYKKASIAFLVLCIGYVILLDTTRLANFCVGSACLLLGTIYFLRKLHRYYMWK